MNAFRSARARSTVAGIAIGVSLVAVATVGFAESQGSNSGAPSGSPSVPFTWTVRALPTIAIEPGEGIPVSIVVAAVKATGVTVLQSALVDSITEKPLADGALKLWKQSPGWQYGPVRSGAGFDANTPNRLWLAPVAGAGKFTGSVTIASKEKPEGDTVQMTVYSSSLQYKLVGVVVILVAVLIAWLLTVLVRNLINRNQLLVPVAELRATLEQLASALGREQGRHRHASHRWEGDGPPRRGAGATGSRGSGSPYAGAVAMGPRGGNFRERIPGIRPARE